MNRNVVTCGGCVLSMVGALAATLLWLSSARTRIHLGRGFENEGMGMSVLFTELPLAFLAGAVLPALVYAPLARVLGGKRAVSDDHRSDDHR
ncbi:hypothetical protein [Streptomyces sp. LBL]|uniref:hypothetical protein n=1 Tax=Streptomyces sp. LBL TaxID=2940562 RepID=UPI002473769F|nr:hypothetical protein [Streptomyces sp. LBL]